MDPWAIVHWCTELRGKRLLVENVPEFLDWGPLDLRTGRPIKRRRGEYFRAWTAALQGAGFKLDWRIVNAADFGDATTRERFFWMARSDGKRVHWPDPTHSRSGEADLLGHGRHKWRAAREIIDWSIEGKCIFDRKRPLSSKTLGRIYAGAVKFCWLEPFLVILRNNMDVQDLDRPLPTLCAGGTHIGLAEPFLLRPRPPAKPLIKPKRTRDRQRVYRAMDRPPQGRSACGRAPAGAPLPRTGQARRGG
jgi:DNA (cytosine-5)-methyltransferase 1